MTIDETIAKEKEIAKEQKTKYDKCPTRMKYCCEMCFHNPKCNEVAEYHEQLAEWLEELKALREEKSDFQIMAKDIAEGNYEMGMENGYNKAIDDFAKAIVDRGLSANDDKYFIIHYDNYLKVIREIAEQLKAGDNNGT